MFKFIRKILISWELTKLLNKAGREGLDNSEWKRLNWLAEKERDYDLS